MVREFCSLTRCGAITENTALAPQMRVRHMSSLGPSAGLAKRPARMSEHGSSVVVRRAEDEQTEKCGARILKECDRRIYVYELRAAV
jgi:hypothetical protein